MSLRFPLSYHPPATHHGHWSITDAEGEELACPHTPPNAELIALILGHNPAPTQEKNPAETTGGGLTPAIVPAKKPDPAATSSWRVTTATSDWMTTNDVTDEQLHAILAAGDTMPASDEHPDRIFYCGQGYRVLAVPDQKLVLGIYPALYLRNGAYETPRATVGTKNDPRRPLPSTPPAMLELLHSQGFITDLHRGHYEIRHPTSPQRLTMPSTPSDHRWHHNFASQIKSTFGVDLRAHP